MEHSLHLMVLTMMDCCDDDHCLHPLLHPNRSMYHHYHEHHPHLKMKIPDHMSSTPQINPLSDSASMEAFSSFTNQSTVLRVDTDNVQPQMDQSDMHLHDCVEEPKDDFSPPQNEQNSPQWENYEVTIVDIHSPPCHIDV